MTGPYEDDGVDLLTSDFSPERAAFTRRLTTALRLLASDAGGARSPSASVHPARAQEALVERRARRALDALEDVYAHGLVQALDGRFLSAPRPRRPYAEAWVALARELGDERDGHQGDAGLVLPGPGASVGALLEALDRGLAAWSAALGPLGRARSERLRTLGAAARGELGARELRARFDGLIRDVHALPTVGAPGLRRALLLDRIALSLDERRMADLPPLLARVRDLPCRLADCSGPGEAVGLFARWVVHRDVPFPRLSDSGARALGVAAPGWSELGRVLAGGAPDRSTIADASRATEAKAPRPDAGSGAGGTDGLSRRLHGARAVLVVRFDSVLGRPRVVAADGAPGLADRLDPWARGRAHALREAGAPEHEAVRRGVPLAWCGAGEAATRVLASATLGADRSDAAPPQALLVAPLFGASDEVRGVLWIELDHPLLPSVAARRAAELCAAALLDAPDPVALESNIPPSSTTPVEHDRERAPWRAAIGRMQLKLAERRWVAFRCGHGAPGGEAGTRRFEPLLDGGQGELGARNGSVEPVLERVLGTGGAVHYGGGASLFAGTCSGLALPVRVGALVPFVLVLESMRRGDLGEADAARWGGVLQGSAGSLLAALVDARDRALGFSGIALDPDAPDAVLGLDRLARLGATTAPLCLVGPRGSGRSTWARAIGHTAVLATGGRVHEVDPAAIGPSVSVGESLHAAGLRDVDVLVVRDVDTLPAAAVAAWAKFLRSSRARVLVTAAGSAPPPIARGLGAACLRVPALAERRLDVIPIARSLLSYPGSVRAGAECSLREDGAAALFRQRWEGGAPELRAVLATARIESIDGALDRAVVERALAANGLEPVTRVPSREPDPRVVAAALWWTRTSTGRTNKARASTYLGWDPATLAARLRDLGLHDLTAAEELLRTS